ncbi:Cobalamin biosynthesis protein CbiD [Acetoanaerobium sticklandii]|uniref:Cobalt-precorrin-5B C(1)-methyltransferase n=1 Tax=Acetoanaerobium sticklandii (strain ATCC 12662 / DSM 519 / JCM 1433 / CCUG 9281 / NCIMB 10654 / HF) TaxID=499177 RepID=E3PXE6_ACESD|nr:cobalt-precorrin-5B (C(1))-methyltransferase CbiD [Acetoanaerobium sticklandii]CBH21111.1 Cobalamin biosynthesis protein CbiD [Acetoanaerobium sticklandii]
MEFYEKQLGSVSVDGKLLRRGFTTGTAAAAAAKGAYLLLSTGEVPDIVDVKLQSGLILKIITDTCNYDSNTNTAFCSVKKYAGDDIDVTNQLEIVAKVSYSNEAIIKLTAGEGIGIITRNGLQLGINEPAINPKPRELIFSQFENESENLGLNIEISVPNGKEVAKKTFNPRLGIVGGISILGTTGIVEPMSEDAFKRSLLEELKQKKSEALCFTFGNMGEKNLIARGVAEDKICICSNFIGYMLREASSLGVKKVLLSGHLGKMVKLSGGIFNTHSHIADAKNEIIAANLALLGAPKALIEKVMQCLTAEESISSIREYGYNEVFDILAQKAAQKSHAHTYNEILVETMMFDLKGNLICESNGANTLLEELIR